MCYTNPMHTSKTEVKLSMQTPNTKKFEKFVQITQFHSGLILQPMHATLSHHIHIAFIDLRDFV